MITNTNTDNNTNRQPEADPALPTAGPPPADPTAYGWLGVHILKTEDFSQSSGELIPCKIAGTTNLETFLAKNSSPFSLPVGNYSVLLTHPKVSDWRLLGPPIEIHSQETNNLNFTFAYADFKLHSAPEGASVSWPPWAAQREQTNVFTPFTNHCRSGAMPLTVHKPHYLDRYITNYFYPTKAGANNPPFTIPLTRKPVPMAGKPWTNSLDMVFRWVEPRKLWACEIETRVRDYRFFVGHKDGHDDLIKGMFSVTSKGWKQLGYSWDNPGPDFSTNADYPVIGVSWADATNFCGWLTRHELKGGRLDEGQHYRLPTTNEWFALAGGRLYPWGDTLPPKGNYAGTEVLGPNWPALWPVLTNHDAYPRTAPVYALGTNELGFYHLGGNAAEWCQEQVLCGGSWFDGESEDLAHLQTTVVTSADPNERQDRNGFRVFLEDSTTDPESP